MEHGTRFILLQEQLKTIEIWKKQLDMQIGFFNYGVRMKIYWVGRKPNDNVELT